MLCAALLLTGCAGNSPQSSGIPDINQIFSGGTPTAENNDMPSNMLDISSQQLVSNIRIGWNLGNTLESCVSGLDGDDLPDVVPENGSEPDETLWGNPPASIHLFETLVDSRINAVRLPITWRGHVDENWDIDENWLNRIQQVVDYAFDCGMYVIITMYHDGASDTEYGAWLRSAADDYDTTIARYKHLWEQISDKFRTYNERLLYESMNEVGFFDIPRDEAYSLLNRINQEFVNTVRSSGGNNAFRHLVISGYMANVGMTCDSRFVMPQDDADKCILSVHYYAPLTFCKYPIQNYWGTDSEQSWMESQIDLLKTTFVDNGIPVIISEYGTKSSDAASRVFYCEKLSKLCHDSKIAAFLWDDGSELDRESLTWRTPELIEALKRSSSGNAYTPKKMEISD